jgi:hypothetical protein
VTIPLQRDLPEALRRWLSSLEPVNHKGVLAWSNGREHDPDDVRRMLDACRPHTRRRTLFEVGFSVDRICDSSSWSWRATVLTPDLALLCELGGEMPTYGRYGEIFGVFDRRRPLASAALLLAANVAPEEMRLSDDGLPFHELSAKTLRPVDVYRLVLAFYGYDGLDVCVRADEEIARFLTEEHTGGLAEIERLLAPCPKQRRTR